MFMQLPSACKLIDIARLPRDPEARSLIVGICVTGIYSIDTGAQVGMWPASQAPYCEYLLTITPMLMH
jgi:hypothetical protein